MDYGRILYLEVFEFLIWWNLGVSGDFERGEELYIEREISIKNCKLEGRSCGCFDLILKL